MSLRSTEHIFAALLMLFLCSFAVAAPSEDPSGDLTLVRRAHYIMGTVFEIEAYGGDRDRTAAAVEEAFQAIRRADTILSDYREDSELIHLNREGERGYVAVSPDLFGVLETSAAYSRLTDGAFDVTVGPLVDIWRRASKQDLWPEEGELRGALARVGFGHLQFDASRRAVRFKHPGMRLDFGGIGKGWAIDRAREVLRKHGIGRALLSAGTSSVYALGAPPGEAAWKIAVRHPLEESGVLAVASLRDESLSTSASYEHDEEIAGGPYSHILDPRTGLPVHGMWSTTVIAPTATESDALSTAAFVLGLERSEQLLRRLGLSGVLAGKGKRKTELIVRRIAAPNHIPLWSDGNNSSGSDDGRNAND